mgnify:CR=1 FL=1
MIHKMLQTHQARIRCAVGAAARALATLTPAALALDSKANAALKFWQAWAQISPQALDALGEVDTAAISQPQWTAPEALIGSEALNKPLIGALERAALMEQSDFGIEYDQWPNTIIAHLTPMRNGAKLLAINARIAVDAGDHAGAARSLAAGYAMARHSSADGTMIGSLVGVAIFTMTDSVAAYSVEKGALDANERAEIRRALEGFASTDPFGIRRAFAVERDLFTGWLRSVGAAGDDQHVAQRIIAALTPLVPNADDLKGLENALAGREALSDQLALYGVFFDQVLAAWERPGAGDTLAELQKGAQSGAFGGFVQLVAPSLTRLHERDLTSRAALQEARRRMEK